MSAAPTKTQVSAIQIVHAITRGQLMTQTNGSPLIKLVDACPSRECHKATTMVKISAKRTRMANVTAVMTADGAGLATRQRDGTLLNLSVVASLQMKNGPLVTHAMNSTIWTAALTVTTASGLGQQQKTGTQAVPRAAATQERSERLSGVANAVH